MSVRAGLLVDNVLEKVSFASIKFPVLKRITQLLL